MSAATSSAAAGKAAISDKATEATQKPAAALEQDDEFEDFPVDGWFPHIPYLAVLREEKLMVLRADWTQEETEVPGDNTHLWEESWDDDDTSEDFSAQLK